MISLSNLGRLILFPLVVVFLTVQYYTVGTNFTNANTKSSLWKTLLVGSFRHFASSLSIGDAKLGYHSIRALLVWLPKSYKSLPGYSEQYTTKEQDGVESLWLTRNLKGKDSPIFLYIHGGCFALQFSVNYVVSLANFYWAYRNQYGEDISILVVDYSLTCQGSVYPTQINEANDVYDKLVAEGYTNIVVGGDSAGANLAVNNLMYLAGKRNASWPKGCVAISPYLNVSKAEDTGSFRSFHGFDILSHSMLKYFGNAYTNGDEWLNESAMVNIELNLDKVDWSKIPIIASGDLLVVFGDHEVLTDEILRWCEKIGLTSSHPERIAIDIDGVHIGVFLNEAIAYGSLDDWAQQFCSKTILEFLHEKFSL